MFLLEKIPWLFVLCTLNFVLCT